jgi:hypothetical protein
MSGGKRIAVMQPYFFPYAGYFRLFTHVDEFVLLDSVQFPRSGRVHRSETAPGSWLSLPMARQPLATLIRELEFGIDARGEFDRRLAAQPWLSSARGEAAEQLREYLHAPLENVVDYLEDGLRLVNRLLGIDTPILRSSSLSIAPELRGQDRILAIAAARGARSYLNSPGGRALYQPDDFAAAGLALEFLPDYSGRHFHLLPALARGEAGAIAAELGAGA